MAILGKFDDATTTINSVDLSAFVKSVTINTEASEESIAAMGAGGWDVNTIGRQSWSVDVEFWQSFYTAEVDVTLQAIAAARVAVPLSCIPDTGSASAVNPDYNGNVFLTSYQPIAGSYDENAATTVSFVGTGALTRASS